MPLQFEVEVRKESLSRMHNLEMELLSKSWVRYQRVLFNHKCSVSISSCLAPHHHVPSRLTSVATLPWSQDQPAHLVLLSPSCPLAERNLGLASCWEPAPVPWCWWSPEFANELGLHLRREPLSTEVQDLGVVPLLPVERWPNADPCQPQFYPLENRKQWGYLPPKAEEGI